ncbi:restriction endonuclease subunit S [Aliarcobacter cryaerophilus]|mgnify:CR=1 FL=1|uniref:restriction endonuclease subunit S n=1 Tax=Aliarcobacter cryaerophilus TaxID=28198 RepID=UPI003DA301EE
MSSWKECKLGEVLELKYGKDHKALNDGNIPVFGSGGVMRYADTSLYDDESILIPRKGTLSNIFYINEPFWTVDTIFWSKINKKEAFGKFLFYQLKTIDFANLNVGSAVPSLTTKVLNEVDISLPVLEEQKAIAEVLSSFDDKIDLLHRQNQTLESLAQTLFRQWFIEEAKEKWEIGTFDDLVEVSSGKSLKRELFDDMGKYEVLGANGKIGKTNEWLFEEKLIYTGRVGTLGNVFLIDEDKKVWLSDNTLVVKPKKYFYFIYFLMIDFQLKNLNVGSTQPLVRQSDLKNIEILLPNDEIVLRFEQQSKNIFKKINQNKKQIQTLENLRDTLLPNLLSGEVRVNLRIRRGNK